MSDNARTVDGLLKRPLHKLRAAIGASFLAVKIRDGLLGGHPLPANSGEDVFTEALTRQRSLARGKAGAEQILADGVVGMFGRH